MLPLSPPSCCGGGTHKPLVLAPCVSLPTVPIPVGGYSFRLPQSHWWGDTSHSTSPPPLGPRWCWVWFLTLIFNLLFQKCTLWGGHAKADPQPPPEGSVPEENILHSFFFWVLIQKLKRLPNCTTPPHPPTLSRFWGGKGGIWRLILEGLVYLLCAEAGA